MYQIENYAFEWDPGPWRRTTFSGQPVPDLRSATCLLVETRSGELAARIGRLAADRLPDDVWFIDHNDVVWAASEVDPKVIRFV